MDIVVIINLIDQEILYEEIPHLNPTTVKKCQNNPFLENMGASKLIDVINSLCYNIRMYLKYNKNQWPFFVMKHILNLNNYQLVILFMINSK